MKAEIPFPSNGDNFMAVEMKESPFWAKKALFSCYRLGYKDDYEYKIEDLQK